MNKKLEQFSIELERLLINNKYILNNNEELIENIFGSTSLEDKINQYFAQNNFFDYFIIGKTLFFTNNIDILLKNSKNLISFMRVSTNFLIIKEDFDIDALKQFIPISLEKTSKNIEINSQNNWDSIFNNIKNLEVTIKSKYNSKYFNFENKDGVVFKLEDIISTNFETSCETLFNSKANNYKKNKLQNALFLEDLTLVIKNRKDLDSLIEITKDKIGDFKIISSYKSNNKDWDNLNWTDIKKLKETE